MLNRMRAHPLWRVRQAACLQFAIGAMLTLAGGMGVGTRLYDSGNGPAPGLLGALDSAAGIFLLIPGLIHLISARLVWRGRPGAVLGAAIYTWVLVGLLAIAAATNSVLIIGPPIPFRVEPVVDGLAMLILVALLWCLRMASRSLRAQAARGFDVIR